MRTVPACLAALTLAVPLTACGTDDASPASTAAPAASVSSSSVPSSSVPAASVPAASVPAASSAGTAPSVASSAAAELAYVEAAAWTADPARFAGRRVVLFFHAPWCPNCRANEKDIKERLGAGTFPAGLTIVKVDYDSSTDLKARYGVVQQDTFVPVDAAGAKAGEPVTDPRGVAGLVQAIG